MKKTSLTLFTAFMTATTIVNAQKIKWTQEQGNGGEIVRSIIGYDTSGYYIYRCPEAVSGGVAISGNVIEKRNYDNKVIFSKDVDVSENGEQCYYVKAVMMKNGPVVIVFNKKDKGYYAVNINNDGSMGSSALIMDDNSLSLFGYGGGNFIEPLQQDDYATHTVVSADKSFLLAYHVDKGHKTVSVAVFGSDLKQTWARDIAFEQSDFKLDKKNKIAAVLTAGNKAWFFTVNTSEKGAWPLYSMYTVGSTGNPQKTALTPDGNTACMTSADFKISHEGDILIAGLTRKYNPGKGYDEEGATGYCIMRADASSGKITLNKTQDFDNTLLLNYCSQKKIAKGEGILKLSINRIVENADKSILLLSEQDGYGVYSSPMEGQAVHLLPYTPPDAKHSGSFDVVIVKVNPDGSHAWTQDIPKSQCFNNLAVYPMYASMASSYGYWISENNLCIIYNDSKKNAAISADQIEKNESDLSIADLNHSTSALILETINLSDGSLKRKELMGQYEKGNNNTEVFCPMTIREGNNVVLFRSDHKYTINKEQFGKVDLSAN